MPVQAMLLSFQGRLRRRDFWLCTLGLIVVSWVLNSIVSMMFAPAIIVAGDSNPMRWAVLSSMMSGFWIVALVLLWPSLAVGIKRCHDRNKSGWWLLLACIPFIGWIWWVIDLGLLDGTPGSNQYGPSPKGLGAEPAAT